MRGLVSLQVTSSPLALSMQATDDNKLFVGGLPWALDSEDLREVNSAPSRTKDPRAYLSLGRPNDFPGPNFSIMLKNTHCHAAGLPGVWGHRAG